MSLSADGDGEFYTSPDANFEIPSGTCTTKYQDTTKPPNFERFDEFNEKIYT